VQRRNSTHWLTIATLIGLLSFVTVVLIPYRAERAISSASVAARSGDLTSALDAFALAQRLRKEVGLYHLYEADVLQQVDRQQEALDTLVQGAIKDPGSSRLAASAGLLASQLGQMDLAEEMFALALDRDPYNPLILSEAARAAEAAGSTSLARARLETALAVSPGAAELEERLRELEDGS
jgi:tetratricopeptide (TPR) repeat protein